MKPISPSPRLSPRRAWRLFVLSAALFALLAAPTFAAEGRRNVIVMIGDGMGLSAVAHTHYHQFGMAPAEGDNRLAFEKWPAVGLVYTPCTNDIITDSAAAASALFTGRKHARRALAVDEAGKPIPTLFESAKAAGMAVGVLTSVPITDATPAATCAHVPDRGQFDRIYQQMLAAKFDVLLGAGTNGANGYLPAGFEEKAMAAGFNLVRTKAALDSAEKLPLLGIFGKETLPLEFDRLTAPSPEPTLLDLTRKTLKLLENRKEGFLLLIEGGAIDWCAHDGQLKQEIQEVLGFEAAVKEVENWVRSKSSWDETLVIVTADHETGELSIRRPILKGSEEKQEENVKDKGRVPSGGYAGAVYGSPEHSAQPVPLFAKGADAMRFNGVLDNTSLFRILMNFLRLSEK